MVDLSRDGVFAAETEAEKAAVYRIRYDIYVVEMDRYKSTADHQARHLIEPEDQQSRLYYAVRDGAVVGTMRHTWGGDNAPPPRMVEQYALVPFLEDIPQEQIIVGERFMVARDYGGSDLLGQMFATFLGFANDNRIQLIFGDCEPYLLNLYLGMGFRAYSRHNVNSSETGYLIPLVMVPEDMNYMRELGSSLVGVLKNFGADTRVPKAARRILDQGSAVISERLTSPDAFWSEVYGYINELEENRPSLFDGLDDASVPACLSKSTIIDCRKGDLVIKKDNVAQNLFVVLSGILEVGDDDEIVAVLKPGDVFGEIAFLLGRPRTRDVKAATDNTRVISMSETTIRNMIDTDSRAAAQLLLNISKMLCVRLITSA